MVERVCSHCEAGNPSEQAYCGQCGTALTTSPSTQPLAQRQSAALTRRPIHIPAHWRKTGKVVALGVASVAAEVGLAWLHRRQQPLARSSQPRTARVTAVGRRVTERWQNGELQERIDEQVMWLLSEAPPR